VGTRGCLDGCGKFFLHRDFLIYICSYLMLHCSGIGLSMVVCIVSCCRLWIFPEGKIRRFRSGFFFFNICSYLVPHCSGIGLSMVVCIVSYCMLWIFPGFGRERTRDLGYQSPACKPLDHRSRYSIPGPSSP
jgi:hypothetical protein